MISVTIHTHVNSFIKHSYSHARKLWVHLVQGILKSHVRIRLQALCAWLGWGDGLLSHFLLLSRVVVSPPTTKTMQQEGDLGRYKIAMEKFVSGIFKDFFFWWIFHFCKNVPGLEALRAAIKEESQIVRFLLDLLRKFLPRNEFPRNRRSIRAPGPGIDSRLQRGVSSGTSFPWTFRQLHWYTIAPDSDVSGCRSLSMGRPQKFGRVADRKSPHHRAFGSLFLIFF